jgi:hypothetical protein
LSYNFLQALEKMEAPMKEKFLRAVIRHSTIAFIWLIALNVSIAAD